MWATLSLACRLSISRASWHGRLAAWAISAEMLIREAIERAVDYDDWFIREVEKGLAQIDSGHVLTHEAVVLASTRSWLNTSHVVKCTCGGAKGRCEPRANRRVPLRADAGTCGALLRALYEAPPTLLTFPNRGKKEGTRDLVMSLLPRHDQRDCGQTRRTERARVRVGRARRRPSGERSRPVACSLP